MPTALLPGPIATVPPPADIRQMIGIRSAELKLLQRLLKVAESRDRLFPADLLSQAAERGLHLTTGDKVPVPAQPKGVARAS